MCVIFVLPIGTMPDWDKFQNAVYNNPHGYGLLLRDPQVNRLQLIKSKKDEIEAGNDPKYLFDLLEKHKDVERYLHVRWRTEGDISEENTQPFLAYNSNKRQVWLMHNGTLYDYKAPMSTATYQQGVHHNNNGPVESDTKRFNDLFLAPLLNRLEGENGRADILDHVTQSIVNKFWGSEDHNRGLLISSDQGPVLINKTKWVELGEEGSKYLASNNTYFDKLTRGILFDKIEAERKEKTQKEAAERRAQQSAFQESARRDLVLLKDVKTTKVYELNTENLLAEADVYKPEGLALLGNLTAAELETFINANPTNAISLLMHLTDEYTKLFERYRKVTDFLEEQQNKNVKEKIAA